MFCMKCGTQLPGDAQFCFKCGTPQKGETRRAEPTWETCEIEYEGDWAPTIKGKGQFLAKAVNPQGVYMAAKSQVFVIRGDFFIGNGDTGPSLNNKEHVAAHDDLVSQLLKDGWERTDGKVHSGRWWSDIFRRRVN